MSDIVLHRTNHDIISGSSQLGEGPHQLAGCPARHERTDLFPGAKPMCARLGYRDLGSVGITPRDVNLFMRGR